jgi:hypothetical protein
MGDAAAASQSIERWAATLGGPADFDTVFTRMRFALVEFCATDLVKNDPEAQEILAAAAFAHDTTEFYREVERLENRVASLVSGRIGGRSGRVLNLPGRPAEPVAGDQAPRSRRTMLRL